MARLTAVMTLGAALFALTGAAMAQIPFPGLAATMASTLGLPKAPAEPDSSPWAELEFARVRLIAGTAAAGALEQVPLGLEFAMEPGWKIYWRTPGDAGYPPRLDWTGSANLAAASVQWPAPERFSLFGLETAGYGGSVVLPVLARPAVAGAAMQLTLHVEFLTCKDICVPLEATLALDLPAGPGSPTRLAHLIDQYKARVPLVSDAAGGAAGAAAGLSVERIEARGRGRERSLIVSARAEPPFTAIDAFIEGPQGLSFGKPATSYAEGGRRARLSVPVYGPETITLARTTVNVTVTDGTDAAARRAIEARTTVAAPPPPAPLALMLALALLGGLILNLMPCMLPVLALKLAGVVGLGGQSARAVRAGFLASSAGIVASFLALAGVLIAMKAAGVAVGWGIQFQHPPFLVAMTVLVTLFAANLWGLFEVPLPAALGTFALRRGDVRGLAGHFLTGAFATLLATPCSAPFLGTAVGFALAGGPVEILAVFAMLGIGLALPYLAVAAWPRLALALPKPGFWMVWLRRLLSLALAATAAWLIAVLAAQQDMVTAQLVAGLMVALVAALALRRRTGAPFAAVASGAALVLAFAVPIWRDRPAPVSARTETTTSAIPWAPFDRAAIAGLVAAGRVVLVDVTADWCLTCRVNKQLVLERGAVAERIGGSAVVAMRADWTRPSDLIADYLASFGRYGIPFNAVYGPAAPAGIALPELLTSNAVLGALDRAAKPL
jgi:suppressor for copper-sensitivity B